MLDLFGMRREMEKPSPAAGAPTVRLGNPRAFWARLLAIDGFAAVCFACALLWRAYALMASAPAPIPPAHRAPRAKKIEAPKAPEPAPAPKAPEAPPPSAKPEPKAPAAKGPIGSPSVNAPELPQRGTPKLEAKDAGASSPGAAQPAQTGSRKSKVRSVDFTYSDPDAQAVSLLGPFLVRSGGRKALSKDASGVWQTSIYLSGGVAYRYRFEVVDSSGKKTLSPRKTLEPF